MTGGGLWYNYVERMIGNGICTTTGFKQLQLAEQHD